MQVELLHHTPLWVADKAIGKCWNKPTPDIETTETVYFSDTCREGSYFKTNQSCKVPGCNVERIDRVANKNKHSSTVEHLYYNFNIDEISRACLQELARHRIASLSVKSTRYTLKELKDEEPFMICDYMDKNFYKYKEVIRASKYVVLTQDNYTDMQIIESLERLRALISYNISNDISKYCLPEAYKTSLVWSINARSLQNFLALRTSKSALWEIRELAYKIYEQIPEDHKFLFKDFVYKKKEK